MSLPSTPGNHTLSKSVWIKISSLVLAFLSSFAGAIWIVSTLDGKISKNEDRILNMTKQIDQSDAQIRQLVKESTTTVAEVSDLNTEMTALQLSAKQHQIDLAHLNSTVVGKERMNYDMGIIKTDIAHQRDLISRNAQLANNLAGQMRFLSIYQSQLVKEEEKCDDKS